MDTYLYKAELVRVVDGDSVILNIDAGFQMWLRGERCRLAGIDAPEIRGVTKCEDGERAADWLQTRLAMIGDRLHVRTHKSPDKYGRWLVELIDPVHEQTVNEEMVEIGLATRYVA